MNATIKEVSSHFDIWGDFLWCERYGSGHINDTYLAVFNQAGHQIKYIVQRINTNIFKQPEQLMENISRVLNHSKLKLKGRKDATRRALTIVNANDGKPFFVDGEGKYWRAYLFVDRARTYDVLESPEFAYQAAKAFGSFQKLLADIPGDRLHETIPNFHNTPSRLADFDKALAADVCGRAESAKAEIEFLQKNRTMASKLLDLMAEGKIPERITHNDTKINNVMLDDETGEGICVIDLDTIMPGISLYDFGDLVRTSTSPAAEDEKDLSKVYARMEMFEALARGFLEGAGGCLTPAEIENMPFSGMLITFEIGVRCLTDYLDGDKYFKTKREGHNLDRCRTQFKLVQSLQEQEDKMNEIMKGLVK
ncbi:MAG: aminoglycoside phosphotransferase family protein [Lentisphaeria bacterium]|nr:aminoglycoside phosphotransferase family protein [Lentisphaeria bacterium]